MQVLDGILRQQLMTMLTWWFGIETNFQRNRGKGKKFQGSFIAQCWMLLLGTFSNADIAATWQALFKMTALFKLTAGDVAQVSGFNYPEEEDHHVSQYLEDIHRSATS